MLSCEAIVRIARRTRNGIGGIAWLTVPKADSGLFAGRSPSREDFPSDAPRAATSEDIARLLGQHLRRVPGCLTV